MKLSLLPVLLGLVMPSVIHAQVSTDNPRTVIDDVDLKGAVQLRLPVTDGEDIRFLHLSTKEGLSQTRVAQIVQDDEGFLWFATQFGLDRYDGYNFKVFVHDPTRENSLSCAFVYSLFKDRDGTLWASNLELSRSYDKRRQDSHAE